MARLLTIGLLLFMAIQSTALYAVDMHTGPLLVRGDRDFPPYEFINADGQPDGFNIDLLRAIADRLDLDVDIGLDAWQQVRDGLARGDIHLATGMIRSAEREKTFDFSITHAGVFYCLFVRQGSPIRSIDDAGGKAILVHAKAYSHDWLLERRITDRIVAVSSPQEALRLLAAGKHDGAVLERLSALNLIRSLGIDKVVMAGPPLVCAPYAFAVKKGQDRLLAKLNEGIHLMHHSGVYEALYRKWFSATHARSRYLAIMRGGLFVLAVIAGVALSIFIWNRALKQTVQRRTRALKKSERRFQELCDLLPQTIFETDGHGRLTFLNRSGFDMLGLDEQSMRTGVHLADVLGAAVEIDLSAQSADPRGKACVVNGPGIDAFPALLYATTVVQGGAAAGMRGLLVDISVEKEMEKQIIESQKLEALGRLAGGVAHDFNNIVTGISAYAQLIRKQPHTANTVADHAERILTGCDRASDLVRHFLVTAGRRQPDKQPVSMGRLVDEVFKLLQPTYGRRIAFENKIHDEVDVWGEPALVFQVMMNLCVNGAQAMEDSGGVLTVGITTRSRAHPETMEVPSQHSFWISDTGPGIDPSHQDRIFEPFFTTRSQGNGTGIGLFVVAQALADMGGSIRLDVQPGKGARFVVCLPAVPAAVNGGDLPASG
jgi:two-component system sensor histidine kinase EvgS